MPAPDPDGGADNVDEPSCTGPVDNDDPDPDGDRDGLDEADAGSTGTAMPVRDGDALAADIARWSTPQRYHRASFRASFWRRSALGGSRCCIDLSWFMGVRFEDIVDEAWDVPVLLGLGTSEKGGYSSSSSRKAVSARRSYTLWVLVMRVALPE